VNAIACMALALLLAMPSLLYAQQRESNLLRDVARGNAAGVRHWLSQGADPNLRAIPTMLMTAAERGDTEIARMLVEAGARLEERDDQKQDTALMIAARSGRTEVVSLLLAKGANASARREFRWEFRLHGTSPSDYPENHVSALMLAAQGGHADIVERLAKAGARVNARSRYDETALMYAAGKGHTATVRKLLALGAEFDADAAAMRRYEQGMGAGGGGTALTYALRAKHLEAANVLIDEYERKRTSVSDGYAAFSYAIASRDLATVKRVAGLQGMDAASELHVTYAARVSTAEILAFLRERQPQPKVAGAAQGESLTAAAGSGDLAKVKLLLAAGAPLNARDSLGQNALYYAVYKSADEIAGYLVDQRIEVNVIGNASLGYGNMGDTALAMAVQNGRVEIARRLLDAGADLHLKRPGGKSALEVARELGRTDVLLAFAAAGRIPPQDLPPYARGKTLYRPAEPPDPALQRRSGELLYAAHCAAHCHGLDGNGIGGYAALRPAKLAPKSKAVILQGFLQGPPTQGVQQHDYGARLLDEEALALLAYIESAWGNQMSWAAQSGDIRSLRPGAPGKVQAPLVAEGAQASIRTLAQRGYLYTESLFVAAVKRADRETMDLFLAAGMSPSARNADGQSAQYVAAVLDDAALLARLLDAGAELHARNRPPGGGTPAYATVSGFNCRERGEVLRLMLRRGLDANTRDGGRTLLLTAVSEDCEPAVRLLLAAGADPNVGWGGWTPLKTARSYKREQIVEMLIAAGARD
jgi:ankyrin repeat protein